MALDGLAKMCHTLPLLIGPHQQHGRPTGSEQLYYMGWDGLVKGRLQHDMTPLLKVLFCWCQLSIRGALHAIKQMRVCYRACLSARKGVIQLHVEFADRQNGSYSLSLVPHETRPQQLS